jgi:hypothetical protein
MRDIRMSKNQFCEFQSKCARPFSLKHKKNIQHFYQFFKKIITLNKRSWVVFRSGVLVILCMTQMSAPVRAALEDLPCGARSTAMAGAFVAIADDAEGLFYNPAGRSLVKRTDFMAFYTHPFGINDLIRSGVALKLNRNRYAIGLAAQTFGNEKYSEKVISSSVSAQVAYNVYVGVQMRYGLVSIERYGAAGAFIGDIGMLASLSPQVSWGCCIKNVNFASLGASGEKLPQIMQTGLSLHLFDRLNFCADLYKDVRFPLDLRNGLEFSPIEPLSLRIGVGTEPSRFHAGFGINMFHFHLDYAYQSHTDLGGTHLFSIGVFTGRP